MYVTYVRKEKKGKFKVLREIDKNTPFFSFLFFFFFLERDRENERELEKRIRS